VSGDRRTEGDGSPRPSGGIDATAWLVGAASLALVAGFVFLLWRIAPTPPPDLGPEAHVLPVPLEIPEFELVDHRGDAFDRERLLGHWTLLFFGYTYCPDICPVTLQKLAPVLDRLGPDADLQAVFVSVDPERDDSARLAEYVAFFHPRLWGASGDEAEIDRLTSALGVYHAKSEVEDGGSGYLVDHSSSLFLVDPEARLHAILHEPEGTESFVDLLRRAQAARSAGSRAERPAPGPKG